MSQIQTQTSMFDHSNLVKLLQFRATVQPNDTAFLYLTDGIGGEGHEIRLTYRELDKRCRALGGWLQKNRYGGKRILLLYPPGLEFIVGFFGCLYAGATAVPIYPPRKNRSMLRVQAVADSAEASLDRPRTGRVRGGVERSESRFRRAGVSAIHVRIDRNAERGDDLAREHAPQLTADLDRLRTHPQPQRRLLASELS